MKNRYVKLLGIVAILLIGIMIMDAKDILNNTDPNEIRNVLRRLRVNQGVSQAVPNVLIAQAPNQFPPLPSDAGTPGTIVIPETNYGQSPSVGESVYAAREDHTHGTPALLTTLSYRIDGALAAVTDVIEFIVPFEMEPTGIWIRLGEPGSAGSTILDMNYNGISLFADQSDRPTFAYNNTAGWVKAIPDAITLNEGDIISLDIDSIGTGAKHLKITLLFETSESDILAALPSYVLDGYKPGTGTDNVALTAGASGAWDDGRIAHPFAVQYDGVVYLYYAGYPNEYEYSIGVATENVNGFTGKTYTKYGSNPILAPGSPGAWDDEAVFAPWVIYDTEENLWKMWYCAFDSSGDFAIGYATAPSPLGPWTKYVGNPVLSPAGGWEQEIYNVSVIRESSTVYKMLYNGDNPAGPSKIGLATSTDGINWTKYENNPVLSPSGGGWMAASVFSPRTIIKVNGVYQLYFSGKQTQDGFSKNGYASSLDLINWSLGDDNPILSATRTWEAGTNSPGEVENPNLIQVGSYQYLYYDVWYSSPSCLGVVVVPVP